MKNSQPKPRIPGITLRDILFAIFRHKWLILLCSALGIAGGVAYFLKQKPLYESQSKLMVRYVIDSDPADGHETKVTTGGRSSDSIMQAEIAILTSWDLFMESAEAVGVERLLPDAEDELKGSVTAAAGQIAENLQVTSQRGGNVLNVNYVHKDPEVAKDVLVDLVQRYFEKHLEIHRGGNDYDIVTQQADLVRTQLRRTEEELQSKKQEAGVISLPEATASVEAQRAKIGSDLLEATVELSAQARRVQAYEKQLGMEKKPDDKDADGGAVAAGGDADAAGGDAAHPAAPEAPVAAGVHVLTKYRTLTSRLAYLEKRQFELEMKFRGGALLDLNQKEISRLQAELDEIVTAHPGLVRAGRAEQLGGAPVADGPDLVSMRADLAALEARVQMLTEQEKLVAQRFSDLVGLSTEIESLEGRRKIEEENFQNSQTSLGKARIDDALDSTRIPNISYIQRPSTPAKTYQGAATKIAAGLGLGGIMLGVGLALLLELVVDHRVKRPIELESHFRIPLMMSIPRVGAHERHRLPEGEAGGERELARRDDGAEPDPLTAPGHFINPYADAVRDRLGYYFEINNMTHKPKLIALAGLSEGAGTTTLAAGLAAAFSEIDDSTVLFLDMNSFHTGDGPDAGAQEEGSLKEALQSHRDFGVRNAGGNLYVATMPNGGAAGSKRLATKKFYDLMPKFRASQFDYIIFDMPTLGPTSPTPAMTGFMDQVILVLDAQNTDRDLLQQGYAELTRGNADVTCIFNKTRPQAPRWIQGAA